jgi:lipoprotein NlpI
MKKPLQIIGFFVIFLVLSACANKKQEQIEKPQLLISEEKMAEILSEIQLVEAYLNQVPFSKRGNNDSDYVYYPVLFEKYKISKEDFLDNLTYYAKQQEKIEGIYTNAIILLTKLKAKDLEMQLQLKLDSIFEDSVKIATGNKRLEAEFNF